MIENSFLICYDTFTLFMGGSFVKKRFAICGTMALLLLLSACGAPRTLDFSYVPEGEDLPALMADASQTHRAEMERVPATADFADAISDDPASAGLLSESEVQSLLRGHAVMELVSKEQAQYDVSLLFRALRSAYGAYEYFGREKFDAAEGTVMQWLSAQDDNVKVPALGEKLQEGLAFMLTCDAHAMIYEPAAEETEAQVRYEYFFAGGFYFSKDTDGSYYMMNGGERWTLSTFSDEHVSLQPTLLQDGCIVYQPTLFALRKDAVQSSVTLKNSSGKTKIYRLDWTESQPLDIDLGTLDYRLIQEDGLTYVSLRSFVSGTYDNMLARYAREGAKARGSKAVIYDLRGNVGGSDSWPRKWIQSFLGTQRSIETSMLYAQKNSALFAAANGESLLPEDEGTCFAREVHGTWYENDVPIIVLVDDHCGSSGENAVQLLKTLDNVLVVGSNTAGYQLCGNISTFTLPYTGIGVRFGSTLFLYGNGENVDHRGYAPDVWCDPQDALASVLALLEKQGVVSTDACETLREKIVK